jgi:peptidoglycan L-alanyl-D-glutamate endopeptidase CwlK
MDGQTGLTYMQQRYYDPQVGRFLSVDPVTALAKGDMRHFNRYAYAYNNPHTFTDPDGRCGTRIKDAVAPGCTVIQVVSRGPIGHLDGATRGGGGAAANSGVTDKVTQQRISQLHPKAQEPATRFISEVKKQKGVTLRVVQGLRTFAEQDALYAQGRTKPGDIVTNARGGESFHNFGLAIDVAGLNSDGSINWNIDYKSISEIGKANGFQWGGDFKSFKDRPHFEMPFGLTLEQLRSGETP